MAAEQKFTKLGTTAVDLDSAWQDRLEDADALLAAGRHAWAIATALYALEIRLKVRICKQLDLEALPKAFEIHDFESLLMLAGLSQRIKRKRAVKVKKNWDSILKVAERLNDLRYKPGQSWSHHQAVTLLGQLRDPPDGVLPWLLKQR